MSRHYANKPEPAGRTIMTEEDKQVAAITCRLKGYHVFAGYADFEKGTAWCFRCRGQYTHLGPAVVMGREKIIPTG